MDSPAISRFSVPDIDDLPEDIRQRIWRGARTSCVLSFNTTTH